MTHRKYLEPYRQSHARHGAEFPVTLWASPQSQELRFRVFTEMCFLAGKRILDAGCGRGDLAAYLWHRQILYERYIGIDALEEVIVYARSRNLPRAEFHAGDILLDPTVLRIGQPQVICISGTLNTMTLEAATQVLENAWAAAEETLLFNFLSARCAAAAPRQEEPVHRMDPLYFLDWALKKTSQVQFRQDYFPHGHDATICMSRQP